jgi:SAM-dependent methyltransferase
MTDCSICGATEFVSERVLWPELVADMGLTAEEAAALDAQQGRRCTDCGAVLRIVALGRAVQEALQVDATLRTFVRCTRAQHLRILDVNGTGALSEVLCVLPGYVRVDHPAVRLEELPFGPSLFDLVLHSDTLEHVEDPVRCIAECRRVLAVGGSLCCTVPILPGRLTLHRAGLKPSYHGTPVTKDPGMLVHSEFGADVWTYLLRAGFRSVTLVEVDYPAGLALTAIRTQWAEDTAAADTRPGAVWTISPPRPAVLAARRIARAVYRAGRKVLSHRALRRRHVDVYDQDGLRSIHNHDFMLLPKFARAYRRGVAAADTDYQWHWRVHVALWAASVAVKLPGDFVECGVNRGFMSSAVMDYLDWNALGRRFFLMDTFRGIDPRYVSASEISRGAIEHNVELLGSGFYTTDLEHVRQNFAEYQRVEIIVGAIPDTLGQVDSNQIAFLHIDLNCAGPEFCAAEALWGRLSPGAPLLLDDYAYHGFEAQKRAMDRFAHAHHVAILSLPTGQGLMIKPPASAKGG